MPAALRDATHKGFSDESSWNQNRYRSIGLVTMSSSVAHAIENSVISLLQESEVREFAWKDLTTAKRRFAAQKIVDRAVEFVSSRQLRIDVLTWGTHDTRHGIKGRDDTANLARMYYHLMVTVMRFRWPQSAKWVNYVDRRTDMDWGELEQCLAGKTRREREGAQGELFSGTAISVLPPRVVQASSNEHVLIQVADLFAGMAAFSWNEVKSHDAWVRQQSGQHRLIHQGAVVSISNSASPKHAALEYLASKRLPYVSLRTEEGEGLRTYSPRHPINFWKYEPQGDYDKAPRKYES